MTQAYFNNIRQEIFNRLATTCFEINIAVCWFTNKELFELICEKLSEKKIKVNLIVLNDGINNKVNGLDFQKFIDIGGCFYFSNIEKPVHNKYCIIDRKILITGSYNWTYLSENNYENITITDDESIINAFSKDFVRLQSETTQINIVSNFAKQQISQMTLKETYTGIDNGILEKIIGNEGNNHEDPYTISKDTRIPTISSATADSIIQKRKVFKFRDKWYVTINDISYPVHNPENIFLNENTEVIGLLISGKNGYYFRI